MTDRSPPELPSNTALPERSAEPRRPHSYSRLTTAIAVLALATASYALWRLDATRDRLDAVNDLAHTLQADRIALEKELRALAERENQSARELASRIESLSVLPQRVQELSASLEELHGRAEGPQRAWSRAEALFLMEIAQRSLVLDRDVPTAIAALESADSRLASVRDPALTGVRQQLARELQALREARVPDRTGLLARLAAAEAQSARLPVAGIPAMQVERASSDAHPAGFFAGARSAIGKALGNILRVRTLDDRGATIVTLDEQLVRKQHLQLLLFSARAAVARHDQGAYRSALASARQWLSEFFDADAPETKALIKEVQLMEAIDIDPKLPDISKSAEALQRLIPRAPG